MYGTVLIPTDGSDNARRAAERGFDLAATYNAAVRIVHVVDTVGQNCLGNDAGLSSCCPTSLAGRYSRPSVRQYQESGTWLWGTSRGARFYSVQQRSDRSW